MRDGLLRNLGRRKTAPTDSADAPLLARSRTSNRARGNAFAELVTRANAARDVREFGAAAALYDEALSVAPDSAEILVQAGHMHKEAGDLERAEARYLAAAQLKPDDPALALQLGHFYKVALRLEEAGAA